MKALALQIGLDIAFILFVGFGFLAIKFGTEPYHRGFFCDDESIKHPVLDDTVSVALCVVVGLLLPAVVIVLLEFVLRENRVVSFLSPRRGSKGRKSWMFVAYRNLVVFIFGMVVSQFLTELGKNSIGRLRPHFLTLCNPDFTQLTCGNGNYITDYVCQNEDASMLKEARLSFPSGHSSFSMYCMLYIVLYIQFRVSTPKAIFLKPVVQLIFLSLGLYTCLSRVSDYKHHPGDVLAGAVLGVAVCVVTVMTQTDFGKAACGRRGGLESHETLSGVEAPDMSALSRCDSNAPFPQSPASGSPSGRDFRDKNHVVQVDL